MASIVHPISHEPSALSHSFSLRLGSLIGRKNSLPQPDAPRRDLDQLVVVDELDRLLETDPARRYQADRLVGRRGAPVRLTLFLPHVDVHVARRGVLAEEHALER